MNAGYSPACCLVNGHSVNSYTDGSVDHASLTAIQFS